MNYSKLTKKGTKFAEIDTCSSCAYLYTEEFWECDGSFYIHTMHSNTNRYTGETGTICYDRETLLYIAKGYIDNVHDDQKKLGETILEYLKNEG